MTKKNQITNSKQVNKSLSSKVTDWLNQEGYPLEFKTASVFKKNSFNVWQGSYVRDEDEDTTREIDVVADISDYADAHMIRVSHVVECKWTKEKPWIIFTDYKSMAPSACIAQTMGSLLGDTCLWSIAGDKKLHSLDVFFTPDKPGFNGRQAFSKGIDEVYSTLRSITSKTYSLVKEFDHKGRKRGTMPRHSLIAFPVIVIDGNLFEASYDTKKNDVILQKKERIRLHWRGSPTWPLHATIDVITVNHLESFCSKRANEIYKLIKVVKVSTMQIEECFKSKSLDHLDVSCGGRGVLGLPPLLTELVKQKKK